MPDINRIAPDSAGAYQRAQRSRHDASTPAARAGAPGSPEAGGRTDSVSLSTGAQGLQQAVAAAMAAPDVREDVVASLQEQVQSDAYQLPSDEVLAEALLRGA